MITVRLSKPVRIGLKMTRSVAFPTPTARQLDELQRLWNPEAEGEALLDQMDRAIALLTGVSQGSLRRLGVDDFGLLADALASMMDTLTARLEALRPLAPAPACSRRRSCCRAPDQHEDRRSSVSRDGRGELGSAGCVPHRGRDCIRSAQHSGGHRHRDLRLILSGAGSSGAALRGAAPSHFGRAW